MNREDIIPRTEVLRMAREAKQYAEYVTPQGMEWFDIYNERFAALVASAAQAKEREACALRAEEFLTEPEPDWDGDFWNQAIERVALAIRARGQA